MGFEGKKVLICGMARSGVAAAQCLYECGAKVTICDNKTEQQLSEALAPLEGMDIRRCLGGEQPDFASYDLVVTSPGIPLTAWASIWRICSAANCSSGDRAAGMTCTDRDAPGAPHRAVRRDVKSTAQPCMVS